MDNALGSDRATTIIAEMGTVIIFIVHVHASIIKHLYVDCCSHIYVSLAVINDSFLCSFKTAYEVRVRKQFGTSRMRICNARSQRLDKIT